MTFGLGLGAGLRALAAARMGIQTAGQNVSNANNPGYSRQRVSLSATAPFTIGRMQIGTGVQVDDITRILDEGLERRIRLQTGLSSAASVDYSRWREIETFLTEPEGGISDSLTNLFGRISSLQSSPTDRALRGAVVQSGRELATGFNMLAQRFGDLGTNTVTELRGLVREVDQRLQAIADLNVEIVTAEASGPTANDLRDTREAHVKEIAKQFDVQALDRQNGSLDVLVGGVLAVSGNRAKRLQVDQAPGEAAAITIVGTTQKLNSTYGRVGALLRHVNSESPKVLGEFDLLAKNLALEFNRLHTTGVPRSGPFTQLTSANGAIDADGDGQRGDELLSSSGLPFDISTGSLYVSVTNLGSKTLERTRIDIDPNNMTLADLAKRLDDIANLDASIDPQGRLKIVSAAGYGFDFGTRLDAAPNSFESFGGSYPSFGTQNGGPFAITVPANFTLTVNGTPTTINLSASDFATPAQATVDEMVTALNAQLGTSAQARNVGGRLVIRSNSSGTAATLGLTDGANGPLAAMGFTTLPLTRTGQARGVEVQVAGAYNGATNGRLTFVPEGEGTIGVTDGLKVGVYDENGRKIDVLDVGRTYTEGDWITLSNGLTVSFSAGAVSRASGDVFALDTLSDSDTSDILVGLGLNSFFLGNDAASLRVNPDLEASSDLLAASLGTGSANGNLAGDGANLTRLMNLRTSSLKDLGATSFESFYSDLVGELGFAAAEAETSLKTQEGLQAQLEQERQSISGVDIDEEMIELVRHQQAFEAASRFINTVNELTQTLINLGR